MAITLQYGPIGAALGLAQKAGAAQGFNIQAQRDMQALQLQEQRQRTINQQAQAEIQQALAYRQLEADVAAQNQRSAQEAAYRNAQIQMDQQRLAHSGQQLQQQDRQFAEQQRTREDQAKYLNELRQQQAAEKQAKEAWLKTLSPDQQNIVMSGGQLPNPQDIAAEERRQRSEQTTAQYRKADALKDQIALLQKQLDPLLNIPDEERVVAARRLKEVMADYTTTIDGINAATGSQRMAPSSPAAPQATSAPTIPQHWAAAAEQAVGPDIQKQLQWIKANAAQLQGNDSQRFQSANFAEQQKQVTAGRAKLQSQSVANDREFKKGQMRKAWADNPPQMY